MLGARLTRLRIRHRRLYSALARDASASDPSRARTAATIEPQHDRRLGSVRIASFFDAVVSARRFRRARRVGGDRRDFGPAVNAGGRGRRRRHRPPGPAKLIVVADGSSRWWPTLGAIDRDAGAVLDLDLGLAGAQDAGSGRESFILWCPRAASTRRRDTRPDRPRTSPRRPALLLHPDVDDRPTPLVLALAVDRRGRSRRRRSWAARPVPNACASGSSIAPFVVGVDRAALARARNLAEEHGIGEADAVAERRELEITAVVVDAMGATWAPAMPRASERGRVRTPPR